MNPRIIRLPHLTIDFSALRSEFSPDGYPRWEGKVVLMVDGTTVTANWAAAADFSRDGDLVDFEGDADDNDPVYEKCEDHATEWEARITDRLPRPSSFEAHHNDLVRRGLCTCEVEFANVISTAIHHEDRSSHVIATQADVEQAANACWAW